MAEPASLSVVGLCKNTHIVALGMSSARAKPVPSSVIGVCKKQACCSSGWVKCEDKTGFLIGNRFVQTKNKH